MDERGIADLYRCYAPAIYAHCRRLLWSPAAARDALQESFVRVLQHHGSLGPADQALRYLYRTSTNLCINLLRQQSVRERALPEIGNRARAGSAGQPSAADRQFVRLLLDRCDDLGVQIAVMHLVDGVPQVEVAETLGISRRTVFNRIKRIEEIAADLLDGGDLGRPRAAASAPARVRQAAG